MRLTSKKRPALVADVDRVIGRLEERPEPILRKEPVGNVAHDRQQACFAVNFDEAGRGQPLTRLPSLQRKLTSILRTKPSADRASVIRSRVAGSAQRPRSAVVLPAISSRVYPKTAVKLALASMNTPSESRVIVTESGDVRKAVENFDSDCWSAVSIRFRSVMSVT